MEAKTNLVDFHVHIPGPEGEKAKEIVTIQIPVWIDPNTQEEMMTAEALQMIEDTKARYMGLLSPEEIKGLRKRHGLSQKQIGDLLQIGEKTYTRWECGSARPSRSMNVLLKAFRDRRITMAYLRSLKNEPQKWEGMFVIVNDRYVRIPSDYPITGASARFLLDQPSESAIWISGNEPDESYAGQVEVKEECALAA